VTFAEAASVPVVFLTAYYGLVDLARLRAGESMLVCMPAPAAWEWRDPAGQALGGRLPPPPAKAKWDVLRRWGSTKATSPSSRTCEFEAAFLAATAGRGVDVVLNSLAGEFVDPH